MPVTEHLKPTQFTSENAASFAKRAWIVRKERKQAEIERQNNPVLAAEHLTELRQDCFAGKTLGRVRRQIALVQDAIDGSIESGESKQLKEYTDALSRLAEIERQLAGRPLPGSLRPDKPKTKRTVATSDPEE